MQLVISRKSVLGLFGLFSLHSFVQHRSDLAQVRNAARRDRSAFDELVARYSEDVRRFVARRVNPADREDVCQDTWLAAWEGLPRFDRRVKFRTWLLAICANKVRDHWRKSSHPLVSNTTDFESSEDAYVPVEFMAIELRESMHELWKACSPEQREILRLYYGDGLTLKEIAEMTSRNLNTVKYLFYRTHELGAQILPEHPEQMLQGGRK